MNYICCLTEGCPKKGKFTIDRETVQCRERCEETGQECGKAAGNEGKDILPDHMHLREMDVRHRIQCD